MGSKIWRCFSDYLIVMPRIDCLLGITQYNVGSWLQPLALAQHILLSRCSHTPTSTFSSPLARRQLGQEIHGGEVTSLGCQSPLSRVTRWAGRLQLRGSGEGQGRKPRCVMALFKPPAVELMILPNPRKRNETKESVSLIFK